MDEIWVKANLGTDLKYEVSNYGRVKRWHKRIKENSNILNPTISRTGHKTVAISINKNGRFLSCANRHINSIVLSSFYLNTYYKWRQITHIDGDKLNCSLENLKWKRGFPGSIDMELVHNTRDEDLDYCGVMIKKYLITRNTLYIQNMIDNCKGLIYLVFKDYKATRLYREYLNGVIITLKHKLDKGRFIHTEKGIRVYIKLQAKYWLFDYFKKNSIVDTPEYIFEKQRYKNTKNIEIGDFDNIEDEIKDMFKQLSA